MGQIGSKLLRELRLVTCAPGGASALQAVPGRRVRNDRPPLR